MILVGNRLRGHGTSAEVGDYTFVLLRKIIREEVHTIPIKEAYYPDGCIAECAPTTYRVTAVLDIDGDMEIVVGFRYYEGEGKT